MTRPRPNTSSRRAFTLLETMLAAAIAALVVFACLGIFFLMNRTDRAMEARANDQAQLERLRFVMERTFSSLLTSDEPRTIKPGDLAVATPVDPQQDPKAAAGADPNAGNDPSSGRFQNKPRFADRSGAGGSDSSGGSSLSGGSNGSGRFGSTDRFPDRSGKGGANGNSSGQDSQGQDDRSSNQRPPPPPRLYLAADAIATQTMAQPQLSGDQPVPPLAPQRLEVVLFQAPVPTNNVDPIDAALASLKGKHSVKSKFQPREQVARDQAGQAPPDQPASPATDQADTEDAMSLPVRAVRGAFELHPQPRRSNGLSSDGQVMPTGFQNQEPTGLWQVWWVPLPRLSADGQVEPLQVDQEDPLAGQPRPFLVASNLRYVKWTAFQERERKTELTSTWNSDLPAYVEVEAKTAAGLTVNWMFEIDWAVGPEVAKLPSTPGTPGAATPGAAPGAATPGTSKDAASGAGASSFPGAGAGSSSPGGSKGSK